MVNTATPTVACSNENYNFRCLCTNILPLYTFVLDILFAVTSNTLSIIFMMVLCTIWHEKVNGSSFHTKGKIMNYNFIFKDF